MNTIKIGIEFEEIKLVPKIEKKMMRAKQYAGLFYS